jgi:hypothetical protein
MATKTSNKRIGTIVVHLNVKVNMSLWDTIKIRISGLPAIDKLLKRKRKKSLIDIIAEERGL